MEPGRQAVVDCLMDVIARLSGSADSGMVITSSMRTIPSASHGVMSPIGIATTCMNSHSGFTGRSSGTSLSMTRTSPLMTSHRLPVATMSRSGPPRADGELRHLFHQGLGKRKGKSGHGTTGARKLPKLKLWSHTFVCLADPEREEIPNGKERAQLQLAGLGEKVLSLTWYGDANDLHHELIMEYPKLAFGGGYELLRQGQGRQLEEIPSPRQGYTTEFLKSVVHNAKIYIRPIQKFLDMSFTSSNITPGRKEKCMKCNDMILLTDLKEHILSCNPSRGSNQCDYEEELAPYDCKFEERQPIVVNQTPIVSVQAPVSSDVSITLSQAPVIMTPTIETHHDHQIQPFEMCRNFGRENCEKPCSSRSLQIGCSEDISRNEDIDLQLAINASLKDLREESMTVARLLNEHEPIRNLQLEMQDEVFQTIAVTRDSIWHDIKLYFTKTDLTKLELPLKVEFRGELGIDEGGLRREFFRIGLALAFQDNTLFTGNEEHRIPSRNASAIMTKTFIHVGWLMAMSIAQGGPGPGCLAEWVYSYLHSGLYDAVVKIADVPTLEIQKLLTQLQEAKTDDDIQKVLQHDRAGIIYEAGFVMPFTHIKVENVPQIVHAICVYATILPIKGELDQLAEGLKLFKILSLIKSHGETMRSLFIHNTKRLSAVQFKEFCDLKYSASDSVQFAMEQKTTEYWERFLSDLENGLIEDEDGNYSLSLEDLLSFISGARNVPPLNFPQFSVEVKFLNDFKKYPKASTCVPSISLPCHPSYKDFKSAMIEGIMGGGNEFGQH